jgi:hypothetical protein
MNSTKLLPTTSDYDRLPPRDKHTVDRLLTKSNAFLSASMNPHLSVVQKVTLGNMAQDTWEYAVRMSQHAAKLALEAGYDDDVLQVTAVPEFGTTVNQFSVDSPDIEAMHDDLCSGWWK